jgi:hypothetical protein
MNNTEVVKDRYGRLVNFNGQEVGRQMGADEAAEAIRDRDAKIEELQGAIARLERENGDLQEEVQRKTEVILSMEGDVQGHK